jgi:hypothetical protein
VRLLNASDQDQPVEIGSGLLRLTAARRCDLLETPLEALDVQNGVVKLRAPARRVITIHLTVARN